MNTNWLKGHADKEKRKKEVLGYRTALEDLKEILERDYLKKEAVRDYETPNWELRQIAVNEYNQALTDILNLIDMKDNQV